MKIFRGFSAPGRWFRGNCHTHSKLSDGNTPTDALVRLYRDHGYDFLVMTDHGKTQPDVARFCSKRFLVINGIELHPPVAKRGKLRSTHHIVGIGVGKTPPPEFVKRSNGEDIIRWIWRQGGVPVYGHPYWTGHNIEHMRTGRSAFGVEAFNSVCETTRGLGDSSPHLDMALSDGFRWTVFATDDLHKIERDSFGGWIMVKARELSEKAILAAIRRGFFYATQGPEIKAITVRGDSIRVECSPVRKIVWHSQNAAGIGFTFSGKPVTAHECLLTKLAVSGKYLRLEITDPEGRKAWTNPVWRDAKTGKWTDG